MNEIRPPALEGRVLAPQQQTFPVRFSLTPTGTVVTCLTCGMRAMNPDDSQQWLRGHIAEAHS